MIMLILIMAITLILIIMLIVLLLNTTPLESKSSQVEILKLPGYFFADRAYARFMQQEFTRLRRLTGREIPGASLCPGVI